VGVGPSPAADADLEGGAGLEVLVPAGVAAPGGGDHRIGDGGVEARRLDDDLATCGGAPAAVSEIEQPVAGESAQPGTVEPDRDA
jgi:hypothetical protein